MKGQKSGQKSALKRVLKKKSPPGHGTVTKQAADTVDNIAAIQRNSSIPQILEVVSDVTDMRYVVVAWVTHDKWVACAVLDRMQFGLGVGGELEVATTLCSEIRDHHRPIVIGNASSDPVYCQHPTPKQYGIESYIAVPIFLKNGNFFGTLCAVDSRPADLSKPGLVKSLELFAESIAFGLDSDEKIDALRSSEKLRRESENQLRVVTDSMPALISYIDSDYRYRFLNETYSRWFGIPQEEVIGRTMAEVLGEEAFGKLKRHVDSALEGNALTFETEVPYIEGGSRIIRATYTPDTSGSGKAKGLFVLVLDITEEFQSKMALETNEARYRAFIEQSTEGIWRFELDEPIPTDLPVEKQIDLAFERGYLAECNDEFARQYGHSRAEDVLGARLTDMLVAEDPKNRDFLRAFIESKYRLTDAESHERDVAGNSRYILNNFVGFVSDGALIRAWGTQRDITESKVSENARARLASIVESSDDAIISKDLDGYITSWNGGAVRIYGYTAEEIVGRHISVLLPEDRRPEEEEILEKIRRGERTDHFETIRRRKDGTEIHVSVSVSPIRDRIGNIIGASKIARDITERKQTEEKLDQNRLMLSLSMQSSKMGAWERDFKADIVWWSEELEQIFGLEPGTFSESENAFYDLIHEDDRANVWAETENAIKEHRSYSVEFRFQHADGTLRWMEGRGEAVYSQTGEPVRLYGVGIDITDRKIAEIELAAAAERLNVAISAADLGDWSWDASTDVVNFSDRAAEIFGISPGPYMTWTEMQSLIHEGDRERARKEVDTSIQGLGRYDIEYRVVRPDGQQIWVSALGQTTYDKDDKPLGMYGVVQDITPRKLLQEAVSESEERFRGLMEQAPFSIQLFDLQGRSVRVNRAWEELWGINFEEVREYNVLKDTQLEVKGVAPYLRRAFQGEAVEIPAIQYDPEEAIPAHSLRGVPSKWVSAVAYPLRDSKGNLRQVALVHRDITEQTRARMLLDSQKESMEMVLSGAPLPDVLAYLTQTVEQQAGGKAVASILLLDREGHLRNGASPSLPADYIAAIDGIRAESHVGTCSAAAADGRIVVTSDFETDPKWKDLKHLPLELGFKSAWSKPILSRDGRVLGTFGTYFRESREPDATEIRTVEILSRTAALAIERRAAEDALRESSEFNQDVIDSLASHVAVLDDEGFITAVNRAWQTFAVENGADWSMSGIGVGANYLNVCLQAEGPDANDARVIRDGIIEVLKGQRDFFATEYPCHSPVSQRWFLLTVSPLTRGGAVISHLNVTDRRLAEEGMRQSANQLELVTNTAPVYISYCDRNATYKFVNRAYAARFGLSPEECVGKKMDEIVGPEAFAVFGKYIDTVLAGRTVELELEVPYESIGMRFVHCSYAPEFDSAGRVVGYVGAITDITQRRKIEEEVRQANERFRIAEQASRGFVYDLDLESDLITRTDGFSTVLGYSHEEVSGSGEAWRQLINPNDVSAVGIRTDREIESGADHVIGEYRVRHKNGSWIWVLDECAVIRRSDGRALRLVGSIVDITARKQAETRLNLLAEISEMMRTTGDPKDLMYRVAEAVGKHLHVRRCLFNEIDLERDEETVHRDYCNGVGSVAGIHRISGYSAVTTAEMAGGHTVVNNDSRTDPRTSADYVQTYEPNGERSYVAVPLLRHGRWVASLWISDAAPRGWSGQEISLLETVAERTWTAVEKLRIDADLRESQSHLQITTEAAKVGTWRWNIQTGDLTWSAIHKALWGYDPGREVTYEDWSRAIDLQDLLITERAVRRCVEEKDNYDVEYRIRRIDNAESRWIRSSGKAEYDESGKPLYLQGVSIDITSRKRRELNAEFLADVGKASAQLSEPAKIMQYVGEKIADHLGALRVFFAEIDVENQIVRVLHDVNSSGMTSTAGSYLWDDFIRGGGQNSFADGKPIVVEGVESGPGTVELADAHPQYGPGSRLTAPYWSSGKLKFVLRIDRKTPAKWFDDEIELITELASRIWTQIERTMAEDKLRDSEERLRAMFDSTTVGVAMLDIDARFLQVNDAFCDITAYEHDSLLGMNCAALTHPDDLAAMESLIGDLLAGIRHTFTLEMRFIQPNGNFIWVQNNVSVTRDNQNNPVHLIAISQDITSRKEAESITRRYQLLSEHARDVICLMRPDGQIVEANKAALDTYGYSREELLQMNVRQLRDPSTYSLLQDQLEEAAAGSIHFETIHIKKDGTPFPVEVTANGAQIGGERYLMSIIRDVSERKKAEMVLRESEERFAKAFNASPLVVTITSLRTGRITEVNQTFIDVTGISREQAVGKTTTELGLWEADDREAELATLQRDGAIRNKEYVFRVVGGSEIVGLLSAEMLEIGGEPSALTVIQDVTERKRSEETLRQSEQRLQQMADAMPQVVWVANPEGTVTYYNHRVSHFFGVSKNRDGNWNWHPAIHPDDVATTSIAWKSAMDRKTDYSVEHRLQMMDGGFRWHLSRAVPILDERGELLRWFGTATDIHDLKVAEDKMLAAERRAAEEYYAMLSRIVPLAQGLGTARELSSVYRGVLNFVQSSMPCSAFFVSFYDSIHDLRIAAFAWGMGAGEIDVSALPPLKLSESSGGPNSQAVFQRRSIVVNRYMDHMKGRTHMILEEDGINPNSSMAVPMFVMDEVVGTLEVQAYENEAFTKEHVIAIEMVANLAAVAIENVRLIDTEAKARKEAEAANRMKDEFLSVLSHELRTPLNAMLGWVRMLRTGVLDPDRTAKALEVIERNTRQQGSLIEDLLDVSRIISGRMRIEKDLVDFVPIVNVAAETVRPLALNKGLELDIAANLEPLYLNGDSVRLQQVITNLLQNAVKFTPAGGKVSLELKKSDGFAVITVQDNGVGIEDNFLPHIFDRFSQADASTRRNYTGLGLGLTIVRNIVELHDGEIRADSDGKDKGATFTVRLPLQEEFFKSSGLATAIVETNGESAALQGTSVLLVDDDVESMIPVQIFLEGQQAAVHCANSVNEALEKLAQEHFDILVSDIGMPTVDGYQFIELVRSSTTVRNSLIPAIALTAYASEDDKQRALAAGFRSHLVKPVDFEMLLAAIGQIRRGNMPA